jgi:tape measure domain-containing protein
MAGNLTFGIRLTADGTGFVGQVNVAKDALRELSAAGRATGREVGTGVGAASGALRDLGAAGRTAGQEVGAGVGSARRGVESISRQLTQLRALAAGFGVATGLTELLRQSVSAADAMTNLAARLDLVTGSSDRTAAVQARLFQIAQASRVSFVELGATYAQVARSTAELGISQDRVLGVTQALSQAITISGGSASSAQAAMVQLSQGLASGTLRGEELNSILEQTPRVAQAIADGMGVSVGQLRKLGEEGALTARAIVQALERSAPQLAAEFAKIRPTISGAFQALQNSATDFIGEVDRSSGASQTLAEKITELADALTKAKSGVDGFLTTAKPIAEMAAWAAGAVALARGLQAIAAVGVGGGLMALLAKLAGLAGGPIGVAAAVGGLAIGGIRSFMGSETGREWQANQVEQQLETARRFNPPDSPRVKALERELAELRATLPKPPQLAGPDPFQATIQDEVDREAAGKAAARDRQKYVSSADNQSRAQRQQAERTAAEEQFRQLMAAQAGAPQSDVDQLFAAYRQRVANIDEKYRDKDGEAAARRAAGSTRQAIAARLADEQAAIEQGERMKLAVLESLGRQGLRTDEQLVRERERIQLDSIDRQIATAEVARAAAGRDETEKARATGAINQLVRERAQVELQATLQLAELAAQREALADKEARSFRRARFDDLQGLRESIRSMADENEARLQAIATGREEAEMLRELRIARLEAELEVDERPDPEKLERLVLLREELRLLRERREIDGQREARRRDEALPGRLEEEAQARQRRQAETLEQSLTDSLYRSFESGKSIAESFRETLKATFGTLILRPLIEPVMKPIANAASGFIEQIVNVAIGAIGGATSTGKSPYAFETGYVGGPSNAYAIDAMMGNAPGRPRARGGQVLSGQTYLVGEEGPEALVMGGGAYGTVVPNHALTPSGAGRSVVINQTFNVSSGVDATTATNIWRAAKDAAQTEMVERVRSGDRSLW